MSWSAKARPTPLNIRKRLAAASEALRSAQVLAAKHPTLAKTLDAPVRNAAVWCDEALARSRPNR
jgi:hypothetical protein